MELRLGIMKTKELAEWMGIKYNTFRTNSSKRYEILKQYCDYSQVYGGIDIKEIYIPKYKGDLTNSDVKNYLEEIKSIENGLSSVAGMARKFKAHKAEYADINPKSLYYRLTKAGNQAFGKNRIHTKEEYPAIGAYGYREMVWAIKVDDYNHYRFMTEEESARLNDIISVLCMKEPEIVLKEALLDEMLRDKQIDSDEYLNQKERLTSVTFKDCISQFKDETGYTIVHCSKHQLIGYEEACAWEQEKEKQKCITNPQHGDYNF